MHIARTLQAAPESVPQARRIVMATLVEASCTPDTIEVATLLVSELVTNVVKHARSETLTVEVAVLDPVIRVVVHDEDPSVPQPKEAAPVDPHGRGLALVAALADRWATEERRDRPGKVVWFEMART